MMKLTEHFLEKFAAGMNRVSVKTPAAWAENYRIVNNAKWSFKRYPWLKEMHNSKNPWNVGQKAAQMGFTETLLNVALHSLDILVKDVMYVLPNKNPDSGDFSSSRFDPACEQSEHIRNMFTDVNNVGHKRAGNANLFFRGSNSRPGLKSTPIRTLLLDEVAEFVEANIPLALERVSGQLEYLVWLISTPTIDGFGISKYYERSDKKLFNFRCPSCSRYIILKYPESLVITASDIHDPKIKDSHLICHECKNVLPHDTKSEWLADNMWVPSHANRDWSGWSISQLYSTTVKPEAIAKAVFNAETNPADEVELFNSKLGMTHTIKGARIDDDQITSCILNGPKHRTRDQHILDIITMGVDVGKFFNYEICRWIFDGYTLNGDVNLIYRPIVIQYGKVPDIKTIDDEMLRYNVMSCVIDANPERRIALDFADRHYGRVKLCYFTRSTNSRNIITLEHDNLISVNRSAWLDLSLGRFRNGTISLPIDTNLEYRKNIKAPVKTYKQDADGNPVAIYLTQGGEEDHYAFSRCYCEIALPFAVSTGGTVNIEGDI